jgi:hypothetical protein
MTMRKEYDFSTGRRGAITTSHGKTRITIRLDDDLLDWFRGRVDDAGGGNYQTLINEALRRFIATQEQPLEQVLRKVLREELQRAGSGRKSRLRKAA